MLKKVINTLFVFICLVFLAYLALPNYEFPKPPPDSLQSQEPADTETPLRRAYFTNFTREQVLNWYENQMRHSTFLGIPMPTYLLNYPPEDSQTIIRDQTRSTFLEEIVHPLRESIYVNGYQPRADNQQNAINIGGRSWRQKIIIRFVPSSIFVRFGVFAGIIALVIILFNSWQITIKDLMRGKWRIF